MGMFQQLSSVQRTATAARRSPLTLPHSLRAAAFADKQLVYCGSAVQTRVLVPAASFRLLDAFAA
jgi:hypothetical protein